MLLVFPYMVWKGGCIFAGVHICDSVGVGVRALVYVYTLTVCVFYAGSLCSETGRSKSSNLRRLWWVTLPSSNMATTFLVMG